MNKKEYIKPQIQISLIETQNFIAASTITPSDKGCHCGCPTECCTKSSECKGNVGCNHKSMPSPQQYEEENGLFTIPQSDFQ